MFHYKVEMGPVNFQNMGDIQMNKEVNKLDDIDTIDGNGQLYLVLQDISMSNFTDALNQVWLILYDSYRISLMIIFRQQVYQQEQLASDSW